MWKSGLLCFWPSREYNTVTQEAAINAMLFKSMLLLEGSKKAVLHAENIFSQHITKHLIIEHSCFLSCILFYAEYCRIVNCCEEMRVSNSRIKDIVECQITRLHPPKSFYFIYIPPSSQYMTSATLHMVKVQVPKRAFVLFAFQCSQIQRFRAKNNIRVNSLTSPFHLLPLKAKNIIF